MSEKDALSPAIIIEKFNCLLKNQSKEVNRLKVVKQIDCYPTHYGFDLVHRSWKQDIFKCIVDFPTKGLLYLSLQGHQKSNNAQACSFGIYVDGKSINTAARNYPSHTYLTNWHPASMSDTVSISSGKHTLSLRASGTACSIHDPDINGFFISN